VYTHLNQYQYPYYVNVPMYNYGRRSYWTYPNVVEQANRSDSYRSNNGNVSGGMKLTDYEAKPFVININVATKQNNTFRTALWTGTQIQVTVMSIHVGEDIGLEMHPDVRRMIRVGITRR
jgi:hypothetical protein